MPESPSSSVCTYGSPQYFDTLDGEHIEGKIMRNVLKTWVILLKKCSPIVYVTSCGTLSQEQCRFIVVYYESFVLFICK